MKQAWHNFPEQWLRPARLAVVLVAAIAAAGCNTLPFHHRAAAGRYEPTNVYRKDRSLPLELRRVAVLPLTASGPSGAFESGRDALEPILHSELEKSARFEIVLVTPDQLRQWTGKVAWTADEPLPLNFFARLREATGCDGVLFSRLTRYQPYQPLAIGWKLSLVRETTGATPGTEILWSVDELLDAGTPEVARSAKSYNSQHIRNETPAWDSSTVLYSPRQFGQFSLATLLATLPEREKH